MERECRTLDREREEKNRLIHVQSTMLKKNVIKSLSAGKCLQVCIAEYNNHNVHFIKFINKNVIIFSI